MVTAGSMVVQEQVSFCSRRAGMTGNPEGVEGMGQYQEV